MLDLYMREYYIDYAFKILSTAEIEKYNKWKIKKKTAREIKYKNIDIRYFNDEEVLDIVEIVFVVDFIQQRYLKGLISLEQAKQEAYELRQGYFKNYKMKVKR